MKDSPQCVRVAVGKASVHHGVEEFKEQRKEPVWGHMHLGCFYMTVGDPRALEVMADTAAASRAAASTGPAAPGA